MCTSVPSDCRVTLDSAACVWVPTGHPLYTRAHFGGEAVGRSPATTYAHHNRRPIFGFSSLRSESHSTSESRHAGIALAWMDEHRSNEERASAFDEWLHHSCTWSYGWRQARDTSRIGAESRWRESKLFASLALVKVREITPWNTRWCGGGTSIQARARRKCLGRGASVE